MKRSVVLTLLCAVIGLRAEEQDGLGVWFDLRDVVPVETKAWFLGHCAELHGKDQADKMTSSAEIFAECIFEKVSTTLNEQLVAVLGGYEGIVPILCDKVDTLDECTRPLLSSLKACSGSAVISELDKIAGLFTQTLYSGCELAGKRIIQFIKQQGTRCFKSNKARLLTCVEPIEMLVRGAIEQQVSFFTPPHCRILTNATDCISATLRSCRNPTAANAVETELWPILSEVCDRRKSAGVTTPSSHLLVPVALVGVLAASFTF